MLDSIATSQPPSTVACHECGVPLALSDGYSECFTCGDRMCQRCDQGSCDDRIANTLPHNVAHA